MHIYEAMLTRPEDTTPKPVSLRLNTKLTFLAGAVFFKLK